MHPFEPFPRMRHIVSITIDEMASRQRSSLAQMERAEKRDRAERQRETGAERQRGRRVERQRGTGRSGRKAKDGPEKRDGGTFFLVLALILHQSAKYRRKIQRFHWHPHFNKDSRKM